MTTENSKYTIIPGGQNAFPPLYRDGQTNDPCDGQGGGGDDPNAPEIYYWGMGLAWEKGKTLSSPDGEHANIEGVLVADDYDAWSPMVDIIPEEVPEEDFDFMGRIARSIWRGCKGEYRLNNVPAVVRSAAIIMQASAEEVDLEENPLVIGVMMNFLIGITASPLTGTVKLNDDSTLPVTITMMEDVGDFGGAALIETLEPIDLAGRKIVDLVYDAPFAYAKTDKVIVVDEMFLEPAQITLTYPAEYEKLNRSSVTHLAGTAQPGKTIIVETGWDGPATVFVDENGEWELMLDAPPPIGAYDVRAEYSDGSDYTMFYLLVGAEITITHPQNGTTVDTTLVSPITGTAEPSSTIVVTTSWDGSENINVDENGAWELVLNDDVPVGYPWIHVKYIEDIGGVNTYFEVTE